MSPSDPTDITCLIGCAVLTGAGAVLHTAKVGLGQSVAVFGVGGVRLSAIGAAAIVGADPIIAVDLVDSKLQFAREFGATHGINAANTDPVEAIWAMNPGGVDCAMDARRAGDRGSDSGGSQAGRAKGRQPRWHGGAPRDSGRRCLARLECNSSVPTALLWEPRGYRARY